MHLIGVIKSKHWLTGPLGSLKGLCGQKALLHSWSSEQQSVVCCFCHGPQKQQENYWPLVLKAAREGAGLHLQVKGLKYRKFPQPGHIHFHVADRKRTLQINMDTRKLRTFELWFTLVKTLRLFLQCVMPSAPVQNECRKTWANQ